jgi:uncharacterized protein (DUF885 family)
MLKQFFSVLSTSCSLFISPYALQAVEPVTVDLSVSESEQLSHLFDVFFEEMQNTSPEFATFVGMRRDLNGIWMDHSEEAYEARKQYAADLLKRLHAIPKHGLNEFERLNYDLLEKGICDSLESSRFQMHYLSVDHLGGIPLDVESILMMMPKTNDQDYEDILSRLSHIPSLIDQTISLLETGVEKGITQPQVVIQKLPRSIHRMIPENVENSVFYQPFAALPSSIDSEKQEELIERALEVITEKVYPAYARLHAYLLDQYLPACRETIGASDLPNGEAYYNYCIKRHTTTHLSPLEIHEIGLMEVERITHEMQRILDEIDFPGTIADYFDFLNNAPEFFYTDAANLLQGYKDITSEINGKLHLLFGRLPKLPYEIIPVPEFSQEGQIGAYYMPGSLDTGRPGRFFVNTFDLNSRPKWNMESLALHEAVPGHHFQISVAQEIQGLPQFRKYTNYTAYVEGWGLYSEGLGHELGLYRTPETRFGRLIEEIWRAVRLVVDTGMHGMGWSRDEAIDYMQEKTGLSEREVTTEIDRYIVWPGQALAYKIGEMSIKKWRQEALQVLGRTFDVREFHDMLLEKGALPLDVCEKQVHNWIDEKLADRLQSDFE